MHTLLNSRRLSRKERNCPLLLLGAAALCLGLAHHVDAQATVGGGSLVSPTTGTLVSPPTLAVPNPLTGMPGPSYGLGGPNMVLVKNWDFGTDGTVKNYDDMSANFFYHDQSGNIANGFYGASTAAPDFQNSVDNADVGNQPVEGVNYPYVDPLADSSFHQPALRSFLADSLQTYLVPTYNAAQTDMLSPVSHTQVASGSFMAKWHLPAGGQLLGQDIVWETKVRYVTPPNFYFALWTDGSNWNYGAEADLIESFGYDDTSIGGGTNFDGSLWHSNMVPSNTDIVDFNHGWNGNPASGSTPATGMAFAGYGPSTSDPFDAAQYHIWTWVYHADNSYQMYVDGREALSGANYLWTRSATPVIATPIDQRKQSGAPSDLEFMFDNSWGYYDPMHPSATSDFPVAYSAFTGTYYQYKYSRVYLSSGTLNGVPVAEGAYTGSVTAPGTPPSIPCTIAASDYDTGGTGSGYHVSPDPSAVGSGYRADNNQHLYAASSPGGNGEALGWNIPNDWYKYTVTLPTPAHDSAAVLTASFEVNSYNLGGGTFHLEDENGNDLSDKMTVPSTNAPNPWVVMTSPPFSLSAVANPVTGASSTHTLRLVMDTNGSGGFVTDFSWMHLDYATTLANSGFTSPALQSAPPYDVQSAYIYNPTGNGWPMSAWTYSGNAGIASLNGDPFGIPANLPTGSPQCAFLQSPYGYPTGLSGSTGLSTLSKTGGTLGNISQTLNLKAGKYTFSFNAADCGNYQHYAGTNGDMIALAQVQVYLDPTFQQGIEQNGISVGSPVTPAPNSFSYAGGAASPDVYTVTFTVGTGAGSTVAPGVHTIALAELPFNTVLNGGSPTGASTNLPGLMTFLDNVNLAYTPPVVPQFPVNGTFEAPPVAALKGGFATDPTGGTWTFTGYSGIQANGSVWGAATAPDGTQTAYLQGAGNLGSISQLVPFPNAGTYTLSLQAAQRWGQVQPVQVLLDGGYEGSFTPSSSSFSPQSVTVVVGTAGSHTLALASTVSSGDNTTFVDSVAFTGYAPPAGVPMNGTLFSDGNGPYNNVAAHAAFDGAVSSFYDCKLASGGYVGIDAGTAKTLSSINYAPRVGYEKRMEGGVFEGSNTSATAGYVPLATVPLTFLPKDGVGKSGLTNTLKVTSTTAYRWLRYRGPSSGYCNVAEIQLLH